MPQKVKSLLREITTPPTIRDRSVVRSSVTPSAKYCCSRSSLRLLKGSTTIDRRGAADAIAGAADFSGTGAATVAGNACGDGHVHHIPPAKIITPARAM